ncbi:hypothetical protein ACFFRR_008886 [Megaselia abdita]
MDLDDITVKVEPDLDIQETDCVVFKIEEIEEPSESDAFFGGCSEEGEKSVPVPHSSNKIVLGPELLTEYYNSSAQHVNYSANVNGLGIFIRLEEWNVTRNQIVTCRMCSQNFNHWTVLQKHMLDKHKLEFFSCMLCVTLVPFESFEQHVRERHDGKFSNLSSSFKGVDTGGSNVITKDYSITIFRFKDAISIKVESTELTNFSCNICGENYLKEETFYNHIEKSHSIKEKLECYFCQQKFYINNTIEHVRTHHFNKKTVHFSTTLLQYNYMIELLNNKKVLSVYPAKSNGRKFMFCKLCTEKFNDFMSVDKHLVMIHNAIAFHCLSCDDTIPFPQLGRHTEICSLKPNRFLFQETLIYSIIPELKLMCLFGRKSDEQQFTMQIMKTWNEKDIFDCEICDLRFEDINALWNHVTEIHYIHQIFNCPKCPRSFTFGHLENHYNLHYKKTTKPKPILFHSKYFFLFVVAKENHQTFVKVVVSGSNEKGHLCEVCPESFWYGHTLQKHMYTKHKIRCYICTRCQKEVLFNNFQEHIKNHCIPKDHAATTFFRCTVCKVSPLEFSYEILFDGSETLKLTTVPKGSLKTFSCEICCCNYDTKDVLINHLVRTHSIDGLMCHVCKENTTFDTVESHPIRHSDNCITFSCLDSTTGSSNIFYEMDLYKNFKRKDYLLLRVTYLKESSMKMNSFRCTVCYEFLGTNELFFKHISEKHNLKHYKCLECSSEITFQFLLKHLHIKHEAELNVDYNFEGSTDENLVAIKSEPIESGCEEIILPDKSPLDMNIKNEPSPDENFVKKETIRESDEVSKSVKILKQKKFTKIIKINKKNKPIKCGETILQDGTPIEGTSKLSAVILKKEKSPAQIIKTRRNEETILPDNVSTEEVPSKTTIDNSIKPTITSYLNIIFGLTSDLAILNMGVNTFCLKISTNVNENRTFKCKICSKDMESIDIFKTHLSRHTKIEKLHCETCLLNFNLQEIITGKHTHEDCFVLTFSEDVKSGIGPLTQLKKCSWNFTIGSCEKLLKNCKEFLKDRLCVKLKMESQNLNGNHCSICNLYRIINIEKHVKSYHLTSDGFSCQTCKIQVCFKDFISHTAKHVHSQGIFISYTPNKVNSIIDEHLVEDSTDVEKPLTIQKRVVLPAKLTYFKIECKKIGNGGLVLEAKVHYKDHNTGICIPCSNLYFNSLELLMNHIEEYHKYGIFFNFICNSCDKADPLFARANVILVHFRTHVALKNIGSCHLRLIAPPPKKRNNTSTNKDVKRVKMDILNFAATYDYDDEHDKILTTKVCSSPIFECKICCYFYPEISDLNEHIQYDHLPFFHLNCLDCQGYINSLNEIQEHIRQIHASTELDHRFKVVDNHKNYEEFEVKKEPTDESEIAQSSEAMVQVHVKEEKL